KNCQQFQDKFLMSVHNLTSQNSVNLTEINQAHSRLTSLQSIREYVKDLHNSKPYVDKKKRETLESEISHNRQIYEQIAKEITTILESMTQQDPCQTFGTDTILIDQRNALSANLSVELNEFRKMEIEQQNKEKNELKNHLKKINPQMTSTQIEEEIEDQLHSESQPNFLDTESERRFKRISEIVKSIDEINKFIKEISQIVECNIDLVDQIEIDVSATKTVTIQTTENLRNIRAKKRRWRIIKAVCCVILALVIIILIAYFFNSFIAPFIKKS
ncbi:putative t-SNARE complex subunit/syntaxin, partial [Pseudoloma neurophilia]